jgi:hypothetical protein
MLSVGRRVRSTLATVTSLALLAGLVVLCPCPEMPATTAGHGCCEPEGLRAATECCASMAARQPDPALSASPVTPAASLPALALPVLVAAQPRLARGASSPVAAHPSPPTVLRV